MDINMVTTCRGCFTFIRISQNDLSFSSLIFEWFCQMRGLQLPNNLRLLMSSHLSVQTRKLQVYSITREGVNNFWTQKCKNNGLVTS